MRIYMLNVVHIFESLKVINDWMTNIYYTFIFIRSYLFRKLVFEKCIERLKIGSK
jgi:hypothetical protein